MPKLINPAFGKEATDSHPKLLSVIYKPRFFYLQCSNQHATLGKWENNGKPQTNNTANAFKRLLGHCLQQSRETIAVGLPGDGGNCVMKRFFPDFDVDKHNTTQQSNNIANNSIPPLKQLYCCKVSLPRRKQGWQCKQTESERCTSHSKMSRYRELRMSSQCPFSASLVEVPTRSKKSIRSFPPRSSDDMRHGSCFEAELKGTSTTSNTAIHYNTI